MSTCNEVTIENVMWSICQGVRGGYHQALHPVREGGSGAVLLPHGGAETRRAQRVRDERGSAIERGEIVGPRGTLLRTGAEVFSRLSFTTAAPT